MTAIRWAWLGLLALVTALWALTAPWVLPAGDTAAGWMAWRAPLTQWTGMLAVAAMSVALLLAARPVVLEPWLGGLDKMYRLHKWLGMTALVLATLHWVITQAPKWLVGLGWMAPRVRPARGGGSSDTAISLMQSLRDPAEGLGEWAFYAMVLLLVLALWQRVPYRRFFQAHRALPVVYLVLVFHAVVLMQAGTWAQPIGWLMAVLLGVGSVAAPLVLFGIAGRGRRAVGEVQAIVLHAEQQVLEVTVQLKSRWPGHQAGQFAFVRFDEHEGPHPFTVSSAWNGDGRLVFMVKGLGDHTRSLPGQVKVGDLVRIEGPYGQFSFASDRPRQVWVGGGIGITPFIAGLLARERWPDTRPVDLFHTSAQADEPAFRRLRQAAQRAGVHLHLTVDGPDGPNGPDGRLTAAGIARAVPDWASGDVWFCGPTGFGKALRRDLMALGLRGRDFHQELFSLR
jgi:predicted ferric reductase